VLEVTPRDGVLRYREGIHIGYRAWLRSGVQPAFAFGSGSGYTSWSFDDATIEGELTADTAATLRITLSNTGDRAGKQVVQLYAERPDSVVERPLRWLIGSAPVRAAAGERVTVEITLQPRSLAYWQNGWQFEPGGYRIRVGCSVVELPLELEVELLTAKEPVR